MDRLIALLASPTAALGALAGVCLAVLFHWLAPADTDTVFVGAWIAGLGWLLGLLWSEVFGTRKK